MNKETSNLILLESKIVSVTALLEKLKAILEEHKKNKSLQEYLLYAAEKKAEEVVELSVSINQEILKEKNTISLSYYESFTDLKFMNSFDEKELKELASTAGFRNRLAHEYLEINEKVALQTMEKMLKIYPPYLKKVKEWMKRDTKKDTKKN